MGMRKQPTVDADTWWRLKAMETITEKPVSELLADMVKAALERDRALADGVAGVMAAKKKRAA